MTDQPNSIAILTAQVDGQLDLPDPVGIARDFASAAILTGLGLRDIIAERMAQVEQHGFTIDHDLGHAPETLAAGAVSYLNFAHDQLAGTTSGTHYHAGEPDPATWPWEREAWRPGDARANLIKAIAIAWATVDRLDFAARDSGELAGPFTLPEGRTLIAEPMREIGHLPADRHIGRFPKGDGQ